MEPDWRGELRYDEFRLADLPFSPLQFATASGSRKQIHRAACFVFEFVIFGRVKFDFSGQMNSKSVSV
jgi:hypothetical protein